ncbi:hypothetical protein U1Q18_047009 [Sarracenia purpurea var. burkii]
MAASSFSATSAPGYGLTDGGCLPCSGVSGCAVSLSPCSSLCHYKSSSQIKIVSLKCTSRRVSSACMAGSSGYRRNPDFSRRQNKHGFSRSRNIQNDEKDGSETLVESELFSSKNGPLLSDSGAQKFQATATPGPREKEIVELFRKVQAQLRERTAIKEEKKYESPRGQGKESESVDSLLKLLRKHTTQKGNRSSSKDFILDQPEPNGSFEEKGPKDETEGREFPSFSRPRSNFQRRSPVPQVKFEPIHSDSFTDTWLNGKRGRFHPEPKIDDDLKLEMEPEHVFSDGEVFDAISEDEASDIDEVYNSDDDDIEEQKPIVDEDLSAMKLPELRALAKSRGLKGFSKLKKSQLMELLSGG